MQVAMNVQSIGSANRAQGLDEMSSNPHSTIVQNVEESMFNRFAQRVADHLIPIKSNVEKRLTIERIKALGATAFEGTIGPTNVKKWLSLAEKCFQVMDCPKERKVKLAIFCYKATLKADGLSMQRKLRE
ncbi:hypothetical protein E6C27_scaffold1371G00020 [Cucumis melo var. makuwa]|uniref:Uncharacterized protein n=1 Tax=Cucumis melo var. makuwa TaxID=1194695 RepID=A0A5A7UFQ1_CUCMM|nr:hypothetical protein E6C27_scaffold1371G00020 [Cucumis melo var. makuwa]